MMNTDETKDLDEQFNSLLNQTKSYVVYKQFAEHLDQICKEFEKKKTLQTNLNVIAQLGVTFNGVHYNNWLMQPQLLGHELFVILRNCLNDHLFDETKFDLVTKISTSLHYVCFSTSVADEMVQLMLWKPLIDKLNVFIIEFEDYRISKKQIRSISPLIDIYRRIQTQRIDLHQDALLETLFFNVSKCISSTYFIKQLSNVPKTINELKQKQKFLFDNCIEFLYWQPYEESLLRRQTLKQMCDTLLPTIVRLMSSLVFSEPIIRVGSLLCIDIMLITSADSDEKILHQDYLTFLKYCVAMLDDGITSSRDRILLECICHLTNHPDLVIVMKELDSFKETLVKLTEVDDCEISLHAYRILAFTMSESDVKTLENAKKIVGIFYLYFISMIDDPVQRTAFQSFLRALKSLIQHDQVKVEVLQQDIIPLLIRCVTDKQHFHTIKIQQYAIEILLALSFNDEASKILEKDADLIQCLTKLKDSTEETIQRAANHLIWELQQKHSIPNANETPIHTKCRFDIMISYSHNDKKLCFQVCDLLEKDGFHVWLDRDQMHGDAIVAMADAIENSEFVIICMSETYKSSPYCQAEANYAFQRQSKLLPIVMKPKYKPDGWLGFITSGKIYVDFTKYECDHAYSLLKNEIQKKRHITPEKAKEPHTTHEPAKSLPPPTEQIKYQTPMNLPMSVNDWSEEHVRYFLHSNNLTSLSPIFDGFTGRLLYQSYLMCEKNRELMFQAMREEAGATGNASLLTLGTYLRFLEQLKKYTPIETKNSPQQPSTSTICTIL